MDGLFEAGSAEHRIRLAIPALATQACALLAREDDQAPRSFSELAGYFAFVWQYRQIAVPPVETPIQCARDPGSKYSRGVQSGGGAAVVSR